MVKRSTGSEEDGFPVEVRRSARRSRTVSADVRDGVIVVSIPAHFSAAQEKQWVARMVARLRAKHGGDVVGNPSAPSPQEQLMERATGLAEKFLDGNGKPDAIEWVTNQNSRWASATPAQRTIRLSHKLQGMPGRVVDYVILHEMAHLIEPSHNRAFWRLLTSYPHTETAKAFLAGAAYAADHGLPGR